MKVVKWVEEYNLGDTLIDTHHRVFFEIARDLNSMEHECSQNLNVQQVVQFLVNYINMHFSAEEELMERIGYPACAAHADTHRLFSDKVNRISEQIDKDPDAITLDQLLEITQQWFLEHILMEDAKIREWIHP